MEENLNGMNQENQNNSGENQPKEGTLKRMVKNAYRGYLRFRKTRAGKIVVGGSKAALMGLGLVKLGEIVHTGKKPEETVVLIAPVDQPEEPQVEEPAVEETNDEVEEAIQE